MHPRLRRFAAPFILTIAGASCGGNVVVNPPPPTTVETGSTETSAPAPSTEPVDEPAPPPDGDATDEPAVAPPPEREPVVVTNPPPPFSGGRIMNVTAIGDGFRIAINRGSDAGVAVGWTGQLIDARGNPVPGARFTVSKVLPRRSAAILKGVDIDLIRANPRVKLIPPP